MSVRMSASLQQLSLIVRAEQRATLKWVRMMSSLNQWCNAAGGGWEEGCGAEPEAPSSSSSQEASLCRPVLGLIKGPELQPLLEAAFRTSPFMPQDENKKQLCLQ